MPYLFITVMKLAELDQVIKFFHFGLVGFLSEFPPHRIQHHFGQGLQARIFFNLGWVQLNLFFFVVIGHTNSGEVQR